MKIKYYLKRIFFVIILFSFSFNAQTLMNGNIPHLTSQGTAIQLIVDGKPFLMLAGEVGNSSASNINYINEVWEKAVKMNLNTLLVPAYWELIEPKQDQFNFTLIDSIIFSARKYNLKIVFLWFGSWKNSMSSYVPFWIKKNQEEFPRARTKKGKALEILTPFNNNNRDADAKAFASLMRHIRNIDSKEKTVIMIQVENEIGMIPDARDYSSEANSFFNKEVPEELMYYLEKNKKSLTGEVFSMWEKNNFKTSGTWEEIFGKSLYTDEIFMAWYFAKYTNYVASAGKKEYSLPMYVNAALIRPNYKPGEYPSAGPLPHLFDIWKAGAPEINFLSPDIYFDNFAEWAEKFYRNDNPLFIPEAANSQSLANAFYAVSQLNAMGYSPFSIESLDDPKNNQVSKGYKVLKELTPIILSNQGKGTMAGVLLDSASQQQKVKLGDYIFDFHHAYSWKYQPRTEGENPRFGALIIMLSSNEFIIAGRGVIVTFEASDNQLAGIGSIEEGNFINGKWIRGRIMNGDQSHQGRHMGLPGNTFSIQKVKLYKYK